MKISKIKFILLSAIALPLLIAACSGGGGVTSQPLSGTVAVGAPISGAVINLIDSTGKIIDIGTSAGDGTFHVPDISDLKAPILVKTTSSAGGSQYVYYGIVMDKTNGVANVTPLTDAILSQSIGNRSSSLTKNPTMDLANINIANLNATTENIVSVISNIMEQIQIGSTSGFNPFTSPFKADGESAADKVNDLVRFDTAITPSGVKTDLVDKSGIGGIVTVTSNVTPDKLPAVSSTISEINPKYLKILIDGLNDSISTSQKINSSLLDDQFDSGFLMDGMNKPAMLNFFRVKKLTMFLNSKFVNPIITSCNEQYQCQMSTTLITSGQDNGGIDLPVKYYPSERKFLLYGNQYKYKAKITSSLNKYTDSQEISTYSTELDFKILNQADPSYYKTARVTFVRKGGVPDKIYNFKLKPADCDPASSSYKGMPLNDNTTNCITWDILDSMSQSLLNSINEKIKLGNYIIKVEAWSDYLKLTIPDVVVIPQNQLLITTDRLSSDGYPNIVFKTGDGNELPHLYIENAEDFVITGTLCISSADWCSKSNLQGHTTADSDLTGLLPKKYYAKSNDGWAIGEIPKSYFIHVKDKANRDMMISRGN
jgi:hypothetical protein